MNLWIKDLAYLDTYKNGQAIQKGRRWYVTHTKMAVAFRRKSDSLRWEAEQDCIKRFLTLSVIITSVSWVPYLTNEMKISRLLTQFRLLLLVYLFWDSVSFGSLGCPGILYVNQSGLELRGLSAPAPTVLGLRTLHLVQISFFFSGGWGKYDRKNSRNVLLYLKFLCVAILAWVSKV